MIARRTVPALSSILGATIASVACARALSGVAVQDEEDAASAGERGLPMSAPAPSFMPSHATGPNAGSKACPLCVYGLVPQFQLWVEESRLASVAALAERLEAEAGNGPPPKAVVPYLVLIPTSPNGPSAETRRLLDAMKLKRMFVTWIPRWDDPETGGLYGHSAKDRPGVRGYLVVNRRVFRRWEKPTERTWPQIRAALVEGRSHVTTYERADAQIAPTWEPGRRLAVRFRVVDSGGEPLSGVKVTAYQTDAKGRYNPPGWGRRAPRLTATAWTARDGGITFETIVPGPYPIRTEPAHIHFSATVAGRDRYRTLWFEGDPLLTPERRTWAERDEETLIVPLDRSATEWRAEHTFVVASV